MAGLVAIVGRPNVGKSTLFNRLVESRDAIVDDQSGLTRDRHYGKSEWNGVPFSVVDTGGYVVGSDDVFEEAIRGQVAVALEEADIALFITDVDAGLTGLDKEFAQILRQSDKPVLLVTNKADNAERMHLTGEFYSLGMGDPIPISAQSGAGTGELLDQLVELLPKKNEEEENELPRIAIIGRPNVGKSSFTNLILRTERSIVTDIAGTTRDSIDAKFNAFDKEFIITDTAGLRRKSRVHENVEFYSNLRTMKSIESADVCIMLLDALQGFESQDAAILQQAVKHQKGVVIMVNKWDLIQEKDSNTPKRYAQAIYEKIPTLRFIPIVFSSVLEKQRIQKVLDMAIDIHERRRTKLKTSELNEKILPAIERNPPPSNRGRLINIKYITQLPVYTPTFAFFANHPKHIKDPYKRYLENQLRDQFNFSGVPIRLVFKDKN